MKKKILGILTAVMITIVVLNIHSAGEIGEAKQVFSSTSRLDDIYGVSVSCDENEMTVYPHENAVYGIFITNTGNIVDTYVLDCPDLVDCCYWSYLTTYELLLKPGESDFVVLSVTPYEEAAETYTITVRATSMGDPAVVDSVPTYTTVILGDRIIDVATDKAVYMSGETVIMSLTNIDDETIEGNPTFEVFDEEGELVFGCYPDCWIPLQPGDNFTCYWTTDVPEGRFRVEGWFTTRNETYVDNAFFFILRDNPIMVATDKLVYDSGENVTLMIINRGDCMIDGNPSFDIYDINENIVFSLYIYLWIELEPGENFSWEWDQKDNNLEQVPDGRYRLEGHFSTHECTYVDDSLFYIGEYNPPEPPSSPLGPTEGSVGVECTFCVDIPEDISGDEIFVLFDWGDETDSGWLGPYAPGETTCASHSWNEPGVYEVRAKFKNEFGESSWSEPFVITIIASELEIRQIDGGLGIHAVLYNPGNVTVSNIEWRIRWMGRIGPPGGWWREGRIDEIPPGSEEDISSGVFVGLGKISIKVEVRATGIEKIEENTEGFVLFIFVFI